MKRIVTILAGLFAVVGVSQSASFTVFPTASNWRLAKGTTEASTPISAWRSNTFNDVNFVTAPAPFWYGDVLPGGTQLNDMLNGYLCIFLRKEFVITNFSNISSMQLGAQIDDGFVAWINGFEVLRVNPPPEPFTISSAVASAAAEPPPFLIYDLPVPTNYLRSATNVIAIQVFNAGIASSDIGFDASLSASLDDVPPVVVAQSPAAGSIVQELNTIQVNFSESVLNVDASDLLINGVAATNLIAISPSIYSWEFAQPTTGTVTVAFAPGNGITDTITPPNAFAGASWIYTLNTNIILPQFLITEFLAANSGRGTNAIRDEDGDSSDWIEIYNTKGTVGSLGGWFLTDATNNLTKWRIPDGVTVPGSGYKLIYASGKNRTNINGRLHTNFQLNNSGEYLALVDPLTNVISEFYPVYPAQNTDVSYGRDRVTPSLVGYFTIPTPGSNNVVGTDASLEVNFSRAGGTYAEPFQLTLSTDNTNALIRYTIVNSALYVTNTADLPTANSTLYTGPIPVTGTMQVRARAFPTGIQFPGPPKTESYIQVAPAITNFVSTLPIIIVHTIGATAMSGGWPTPDNSVIVAAFDNNTGMSSIMARPQLVKRAGINLRGSSTQGFPKSSFAVEFLDEFSQDEEEPLLGLPKESDWVLYAPNQFDISMMHNPIMHQFARDMGYYSSRTRFVEVFFRNGSGPINATTNSTGAGMGDYNGVYVLEEKVKRDGNRVDIDALAPEQTTPPNVTGGYLLKVDRTDGNERTFVGGGMTINYQDPDGLEMVTPARAAQAAYIKSFLDNMNNGMAGNALTNIASTNHYSNYVDVDATIDLHIGNVLVMNADGYRLSGYMYKPRNGKLVAGPLWDVDRGLGTSRGDQRTFNPRSWQSYDASGCGGTDYGTDFFGGSGVNTWVWLGRWFSDVDFWQRWIDRYQSWRTTTLDTNRVLAMVDGFAQELREAQVREQKRWTGGGASDTSPRSGFMQNCTGIYSHTFPGTYQGEVDFQKRWLVDHIHFIDTNLLNRPTLSLEGGQVPLGTVVALTDNSDKPGTIIYYTLDGSDPRGFQGTTNPAAIRYTGPITITNNVRIHARALNPNHRNLTGTHGTGSRNPIVTTPWSGNIAATYFITTPPLVITELMYHPAPPASQTDTNDADNFEFIELKNIGNTTLNLAGFQFTNGIDFTFTAGSGVTTLAPGGYVLVVKNIGSFTNRYGVRTNIAGVYSGTLDNAGERITLVGPRLEPILDFVYSDAWRPLTDGLGFSLVIKDANGALDSWGLPEAWSNSSFENGSPGVVEPPPLALPIVYVSEALTHTDLPFVDVVELHNPGTNDADISGWYLTDDSGEPKKYQFPPNTIIPAGGFALFDETNHFNTGPNAFALGSDGDDLYLFSGAGGLLTGYAHGFSFGAAQNGVTFGRYVTSQGEEHFVAQATNTLGASNSLPLVGPIVISEIMYHPPDIRVGANIVDNSLDEFIELHNITATNVSLFNPVNQSNTWRLTSAAEFTFPTNVSVPPAGFVLVVNFNPQTNASQLAAFRTKYGVSPSIPIFGPYGGKLDNTGESVRLSRPDNLNTNGTVPYILVDRVDYQDSGAWPTAADGLGASLQRLVLSAYGDDATNWTAVRPTAGGFYQGGTPPTFTQQPTNTEAFVGGTATFTVAVSGVGVGIQWRLNGGAIVGATNTTLTVTNVQYADGGAYDAIALNGGGVVFSSNALLTVLTPLTFVVQPGNQFVLPGTNVTMSVSVVGTEPILYRWLFEGNEIPGATNASYSFTGASLDNHGNYQVVVTDRFSSITSTNAFIFVRIPPVIVIPPVTTTVVQGGTAYFTCLATGAPPIFYRWIRSGTPILTNTSGILVLPNVQASLVNGIRVNVVNAAPGSVNSASVSLLMQPDFDGDGIGDPWETRYGLSTNSVDDGALDLDGDGMSNRDEYLAGTNPTNVLSVLKLLQTGPGGRVFQFTAETNTTYSIQARTNLNSAVWANVTNIFATTQTRTIEINVPAVLPEPEKYYRVVTPVVP